MLKNIYKFLKVGLISVSYALLLTSCASTKTSNNSDIKYEVSGEPGVYYDSALNDHNLPPLAMRPSIEDNNGGLIVDPTYLRTQADYNYSLGEAYSMEGQSTKAIEAFKLTLVYDPNAAPVHLRLAAEYIKAGMIVDALEQTQKTVKLQPENTNALMLLAGIYSSLRTYDKAITTYEKILDIEPNNNEAPIYLGAVYTEQKRYDEAVSSFERVINNPEYQSPHLIYYYIGKVRSEQGKSQLAEVAYRKCLEIKPDFADGILALSGVYFQMKSEEKAIQLLTKYQTKFGPSLKIAEILAQKYLDKENYDDAYEQLEVVEKLSPDALTAKLKMAFILIEKKIYDKGIVKLNEILEEAPESDKVRFYLAALYEETKENKLALKNYLMIPPASQFYGESIIHAAYILKTDNEIEKAVKLLEESLAQKTEYPNMYAMLASLLDESQQYQKAYDILEKGISIHPENAQLHFYLGTINDKLGNKEKVFSAMKRVIELDPNHIQGLNYLAFTLAEEKSNLDEAEKYATRALDLEPTDGYIMDTLGWVLYQKGDLNSAIKYLELAHKTQPTVSVIAEHLGDAYVKKSLLEKAKKMYHKAVELENDDKKIENIKQKISSIENQRFKENRLPASALNK